MRNIMFSLLGLVKSIHFPRENYDVKRITIFTRDLLQFKRTAVPCFVKIERKVNRKIFLEEFNANAKTRYQSGTLFHVE